MEQILVAISGGIDSTATVLMLRERGYSVTGLYIDMLGDESAREQVSDVAKRLKIKLLIESVSEEFHQKIIQYTLSEHQAGRTPSPCAMCNPLIKWSVTERVADRLGIHRFATGHYVRIKEGRIYKGVDPAKDQSYYLWGLTPATLSRAVTPLGDYTKLQMREYLSTHEGFSEMSQGGESMSICFIGKQPYSNYLREHLSVQSGEVVSTAGETLGEHSGYQLYTIGQKKGFTGGGTVIGIDSNNNQIITTTTSESLYTGTITIRDWILHQTISKQEDIHVKVRGIGRNPESIVRSVINHSNGTMTIELGATDAWAVASGQPLVMYYGEMVIGGGIII